MIRLYIHTKLGEDSRFVVYEKKKVYNFSCKIWLNHHLYDAFELVPVIPLMIYFIIRLTWERTDVPSNHPKQTFVHTMLWTIFRRYNPPTTNNSNEHLCGYGFAYKQIVYRVKRNKYLWMEIKRSVLHNEMHHRSIIYFLCDFIFKFRLIKCDLSLYAVAYL